MTDAPLHVLVIDDDSAMRDSTRMLLTRAGWRVDTAARGADGIAATRSDPPDVVLCDLRMPGLSGLDVVQALRGPDAPPVVLLSAFGDIATAVEAVQAGAHGFLEKPCHPDALRSALDHAARTRRNGRHAATLRARMDGMSALDRIAHGGSTSATALRRGILDAAAATHPLTIEGPPGTRRAAIARAIHDNGPGPGADFAVLPADALPGAAVPAGGTVLLEGVDALDRAAQARLVPHLPHGLRLLCTVSEGHVATMLPDLRWRLAGHVLPVPALRDRPDDVVDLFLLEWGDLAPDAPPPALDPDDLSLLIAHPWPGNLRELRAVAERAALQPPGRGRVARAILAGTPDAPMAPTLREAVAAFERRLIGRALRAHDGRMDDVAAHLGLGRRTLNEKIVKLGLDKDRILGTS
ncbi:sigma-54-dependent transcriptional regulator [Jannaschia sp. LMIT008]|uniref:sigma-54-dependent transcriptional regulator n=1 Tax=Jannaschia maritima TaxID=3032585 RepID=UPI002811F83A|nr:response regulator [Jannaschia sp. LMIT008]